MGPLRPFHDASTFPAVLLNATRPGYAAKEYLCRAHAAKENNCSSTSAPSEGGAFFGKFLPTSDRRGPVLRYGARRPSTNRHIGTINALPNTVWEPHLPPPQCFPAHSTQHQFFPSPRCGVGNPVATVIEPSNRSLSGMTA